jgi:hypothetical protein
VMHQRRTESKAHWPLAPPRLPLAMPSICSTFSSLHLFVLVGTSQVHQATVHCDLHLLVLFCGLNASCI